MTLEKAGSMMVVAFLLVLSGCAVENSEGLAADDVAAQASAVEEVPAPAPEEDSTPMDEDLRVVRDACKAMCDVGGVTCAHNCPVGDNVCPANCDGDQDICRGDCERTYSLTSGLPADWEDTDDLSTEQLCHRACDVMHSEACHSQCGTLPDVASADMMNQGGSPGACCRAAYSICHKYAGMVRRGFGDLAGRDQEVLCLVDLSDCLLLGNPSGPCES